jgi:O-antigen ligase
MSHYGNQLLSHNIFIEAASELGLTGFAAFLALIGCTVALNYRTRRIVRKYPRKGYFLSEMANGLDGALIGFLVSGFFVTVLYYPFFWINFAMTVALNNAAMRAVAREFPEHPLDRPALPTKSFQRSARTW